MIASIVVNAIDYIRKHKLLTLVILPAFFIYMMLIVPSGSYFCFPKACGINFWGVHAHDGSWHSAIASISFRNLPFDSPIFSGEKLFGYNFFYDFPIFLLEKIGIPPLVSYFKILPLVWFFCFTVLLIILARKIKDTPVFVALFLFFNYFAGSFSYLLTLYHQGTIKGSSTLLLQPVMYTMSNPPYAFSLLFLIPLLIFVQEKKFSIKTAFLCGVCLAFLWGFKFYGGVIASFMMAFYLLMSYVPKKLKHLILFALIIALPSLLVILFLYRPGFSAKTGSVLEVATFALIHPITEEPNQFYLKNLTDARYFLLSQNRFSPRLVAIELINLLAFLFFYLGTRFFGLFYLAYLFFKRKLRKFDVIIFMAVGFSIILTSLFVQKGEWWNTIQFFFYAIFLMTIPLTKMAESLITRSKKILFVPVAILILILSVPTTLDLFNIFTVTPGLTYIPKEEMQALEFLKKQPPGVIYAPLYKREWKSYEKTNPLWRYEDTAYISAISGKQSYFSDIAMLKNTGVPYEARLERMKRMDCSILKEVDYVYEMRELADDEKIMIKCKPKNQIKIYDSGSVFIYALKK